MTNIHRARTFQDAHDETEWLLYQQLWKAGKPDSDGNRISRGGIARLMKVCHRSRPSIRRALSALREKLAITVQLEADPKFSRPRLWLVRSMRSALELRRAQGLVWVSRSRGVRFVDELGYPMTAQPTSARPTVAPRPAQQLPLPTIEIAAIHAALSKVRPVDEHAAQWLLEGVRAEVPDATADEVVYVIEKQTALAWKRGNVRDVMAWVISTTIRNAEPGLWEQFRRTLRAHAAQAQRDAAERELAEARRQWESLALIADQDPELTEILARIRAAAVAEFSPTLGAFSPEQLPGMLAQVSAAVDAQDLDAYVGRKLMMGRKRA